MADRILILDHGTAGLSGTLTQTVKAVDGSTLRAATTTGITELAAGKYRASVPDTWSGWIEWNDGTEVVPEAFIASDTSGTGARTVTITVNDGSTALQNAIIRMTEGANSYTTTTNVLGVATFNLDDATYTVAISKAGYSYGGTTLVVDGTEAATYSMTAVVITPASNPLQTTAYITTYDAHGEIDGGETISFRMLIGDGVAGRSFGATTTATSHAVTGLLTVSLVRNATYRARRGRGEWVEFEADDADTFALPPVLGIP